MNGLGRALAASVVLCGARAAEPRFRAQQIASDLSVGYAVTLADMNEDKRADIVVVDSARVVWYENPNWQVHTLIEGQTKRDNVCIAPYDIDGDGKPEFALGADWRPFDTKTGGTIQWLSRGAKPADPWSVHAIGEEPMVHRLRWADLDGDGRAELVVVPLVGRNTTRPKFEEQPVRVLAFAIPKDPLRDRWMPTVINEDAHVTHNFWPTDFDGDGKLDILLASFEGASLLKRNGDRWTRTLLGEGNQATSPNRGASEIKHGKLASGADYIATIEPWHGDQVVVYTRPEVSDKPQVFDKTAKPSLWRRQVLDEQLKWGHAVWCADLDGDGDQELVIGVRDDKNGEHRCGVRVYDPQDAAGRSWRRQLVDAGGVAVEDLLVADLNGDGRQDIVAVGRQTHNARIYWNEE